MGFSDFKLEYLGFFPLNVVIWGLCFSYFFFRFKVVFLIFRPPPPHILIKEQPSCLRLHGMYPGCQASTHSYLDTQ